jgi:hypothetical protein
MKPKVVKKRGLAAHALTRSEFLPKKDKDKTRYNRKVKHK